MRNTKRLESGAPDRESQEDPLSYLRPIDTELRTRWGGSDTYDHARKPTTWEERAERRDGCRGTFRNTSTRNSRCVNNCSELEGERGDEHDLNGDWDTAYYHGCHPLNKVRLDSDNSSSREMEFAGIANWPPDSKSQIIWQIVVLRMGTGVRNYLKDALFPKLSR